MKGVFITGIGTEIGKTVASAVVVKAIDGEYWKPVQAGELNNTDTMKVRDLTGCAIFEERYRLKEPMSPHAAAAREGIEIELADFELPSTEKPLVVEGAGGLMVPINSKGTMIIDIIKKLDLPAIVVSRYYLGSINHTILTVDALRAKGIEVAGILFNGDENQESKEAILQATKAADLGCIEMNDTIDREFIDRQAEKLTALHELKG